MFPDCLVVDSPETSLILPDSPLSDAPVLSEAAPPVPAESPVLKLMLPLAACPLPD